MIGYWNRPDETAGILRDHVDETGTRRWLHTGDLGYLDDDGYVFIVDRKKDLIKTSGYQVWPREIEEVLATHPAVAEVGVAGVLDDVRGEAVKAWVVLRAGRTATDQELRTFCREQLAPYKVPSHIEFRTELPKTMVGKVLRRALREGPSPLTDGTRSDIVCQVSSTLLGSGTQYNAIAARKNAAPATVKAGPKPRDAASDPITNGAAALARRPAL